MTLEANIYPLKGYYQDTPFRIDEELQKFKPGKVCLEEFKNKQGTLKVINLNQENFEKFSIKPNDDIRISCSAGYCRSQTAYLLFSQYNGFYKSAPHGARDLFDPVYQKANWNKNVVKEQQNDEFEICFGVKKVKRLGEEQFSYLKDLKANSQVNLTKIKEFYDDHYFGPQSLHSNSNRTVYITFAANAHIILYRLIETNKDLSRHIVVCIDLDDYITSPLKEWDTYPKSVKAYRNYAKILEKIFDFSEIENF